MRRATAFVTVGVWNVAAAVQSPARCSKRLRGNSVIAASSFLSFSRKFSNSPRPASFDMPAYAGRTTITSSAKQMETDWNVVKVIENSEICEDHRYVVINVGTTSETGSLCDAFRVPGMYVQMRENASSKPGFFAISCSPNLQGIFEFLIKETPQVEWISRLKPGDVVEMSPVMGKGFPISKRLGLSEHPGLPEAEKPLDILLFATGSGIAPIRSAIESQLNGVNPGERRSVKLYYGARYPERMAYRERFKLWELDGVEVIPVMSQPNLSEEPWDGRTGYIQDALEQDGIACPGQTGALLCGVKGMTEDVKAILLEAGVSADRILFNF